MLRMTFTKALLGCVLPECKRLLPYAILLVQPLSSWAQTNQTKPAANDVNEAYLRERYTKFEQQVTMADV